MPRKARHAPEEIESACCQARNAKTLLQLRQAQSLLVPALLGADLATTALILGLGRARVSALRGRFRKGLDATSKNPGGRGGRRRALLPEDDERHLIKSCLESAHTTGISVALLLRSRLDNLLGRPVPLSTVYRMLARHGWRKGDAGATLRP